MRLGGLDQEVTSLLNLLMPMVSTKNCAVCHTEVFAPVTKDSDVFFDDNLVWCNRCEADVPFYTYWSNDVTTVPETPPFYAAAPPSPAPGDNEEFETALPPNVIDLTATEPIVIGDTDFVATAAGAKRKQPHVTENKSLRAWAGTWYLWKEADEFNLKWTSIKENMIDDIVFKTFANAKELTYMCVGKEICPTSGRYHLQIVIYAKNKVRMSTLSRLAPGCHWKPCYKPLQANINYCKKEGDFWEKGTRPLTKQEGMLHNLYCIRDGLKSTPTTIDELDFVLDGSISIIQEVIDSLVEVMTANNNKY